MSWRWLLLKRELFGEKAKSLFSILSVMLGVALIAATFYKLMLKPGADVKEEKHYCKSL